MGLRGPKPGKNTGKTGPKRLSPRHRRFVEEYLIDFNATRAAERAGFSITNKSIGLNLTRNPEISDLIRKRCLDVQVRLEMSGDDIRRGFARIATDPRSPLEGGPNYTERIAALRELGKLLGLYTQKLEVRGSITLVDLLAHVDEKAKTLPPHPLEAPTVQ